MVGSTRGATGAAGVVGGVLAAGAVWTIVDGGVSCLLAE